MERPTLHGAVVALRPATDQDVPVLAAIRATPEVHRRWRGGPDLLTEVTADVADLASPTFAIEYEGRVVGAIQWYAENEPDYRHAGMDIYLDPGVHGRGVGTDAVRTLAHHLIADHGHHRLIIDPAADNTAAIRCYEKAGFRAVGIMRQYERGTDGSWHDGLLMDLLAEELTAHHGRLSVGGRTVSREIAPRGGPAMHSAPVTPAGDLIRWVELPGVEPARVYVHGLGATSPAYFTEVALHPLLAGRRSLLIDLLGFGHSDRPTDFDYSLESHADALAAAIRAAGVEQAEVVAHSMGGSIGIVLAARHPELVSKLVMVDANLDPIPDPGPPGAGSSGIAAFTEEEFLAGAWQQVRDAIGPSWWSTMRLAGLEALHRSAAQLVRGTEPTMRELLLDLKIPRTFLYPAADGRVPGEEGLTAAGVCVVAVPDCGHNIMLDNPQGFAEAVSAALG